MRCDTEHTLVVDCVIHRFPSPFRIVMAGRSRSKNGVALLAYVPAILFC